ncbi:hypothetical protein N0V93_007636 [Gnomoniopsis smithogilvyi]|uniref:Uncharacterized protein n=1 Tax=Gnomoniopsis smithogilvyi TaxID=1191159 RepID=A0A9W8YQE9_9PEZI|nr:hypothetical protein N0V93_007636 [Gnomoniopsis smithogilvyi]
MNTGKQTVKRPLSQRWWQSFLNKKPEWYGPGVWQPRTLDFGEMEQLKKVMMADLKVVVIGGSHKYHSPEDLATFFDPSTENNYNAYIDIGHVAEFFMGGSQGGAQVFHFPAIDAWEMSIEAQSLAHLTGNAIDVPQDELDRRVANLFQDNTVRYADAIVINHDVAVPVPGGGTFENYTKYLAGLAQRAIAGMNAICRAWKREPQANQKSRRIIVLRNSLFWLSLMYSDPSVNGLETVAREQQSTQELHNELKDVGIDLIIRMEEIRPHDSAFVEIQWRSSLNNFFHLGHKKLVKRQIGIDLAMTIAYGNTGPEADERDELYDRVLEWFLPTCLLQHDSPIDIRCLRRYDFLKQCIDLGIGWRSSWLDENKEKPESGESSGSADEESLPLSGRCALVLDSGRDDGITAACCEGLSNMGATVALTFVGDTYDDGATRANRLVETLSQAGGKVVAVGGIPYRMKTRSEQPAGVRFVEELIDQVLRDLGHKQFDIVVNNVGWAYSLGATQRSSEKRRFMDRDSRRNLLALNYVVMYLVRNNLLSGGARVINIAGISCNPATQLTGNPHWKCLAFFMQQ